MNRPSRHEIENSLSGSQREAPIRVNRSSVDLPTRDSQRQSRIIGGNLDGVARQVPNRNYMGWVIAAGLVLFSGLIFLIPEFTNKAPKISQQKEVVLANELYNQSIEKAEETAANTDSDKAFTVPNDRDRAAEYRQTEILQQKLLALKAKADAAIAKGNYTKPANDNALIHYQEMLTLDGNNVAATDGINYMLTRLLTVGNEMLKDDDVATAKKAQQSIAEIDTDSVEYFELSEAISNFEAAQEQKALAEKIASLFKQADQATNKNNLVTPKNKSAVFYHREILKLDPENKKARESIEKIRQEYADLAEKQITERQWNAAESAINNLKLASEDSVLVTFLSKRLDEAKNTPELTQEQNTVANNTEPDQPKTTVFAPFPNGSEQSNDSQQQQNNSPSQASTPIKDLSISSTDTTIAQRERESLRAVAPVTDALQSPQNTTQNSSTPSVNNTQKTPQSTEINQDLKQLNLGLQAYYSGEYITAFSNLAPLADKNNTRAQIRVGYMYQFGRGIAQDQALGSQYLRNALPDLIKRAQQNQSWAQSDLGSLYEDGIIVTRSYSEALSWYRKAAAQNYAGAQTNLGNMYFFGKGVEQNPEEAIKWYRLAAIGGDAIAKQNLIQLGAINF